MTLAPYRIGDYQNGDPKAPVSPEFLATLIHQGASLRLIEQLAARVRCFEVFEAHRRGEVTAEMGALIIQLGHRGRMGWLERVWEAIRWR